jgi:DNA polymerase V
MSKGLMRIGEVWGFEGKTKLKIPLFTTRISAGFPSPADDFIDKRLDFNEYLITHPSATFCVQVEGSSMVDAYIHPGDILIVDKALDPVSENIVIAAIDGEFVVKRFQRKGERVYLMSENPKFAPIEIRENMTVEIWGVVTYVIHKV